MPELPEVETIRKQILPYLPMKIEQVIQGKNLKSLLKKKEFELERNIIKDIERRGKLLIFHLEKNNFLLSHLGMSGNWRLGHIPKETKHVHLTLTNRKISLSYIDPRRFGRMYWVKQKYKDLILEKLGKDLTQMSITDVTLACTLFPKRPIKSLLLEQKLFAGVGNYMANEICAHAKILPTRLSGKIKKEEYKKIHQAIKKVVAGSLKYQGTTFSGGYLDAFGNNGGGLSNLVVFYQKKCGMCRKTKVKKIYLQQRGTYYCPACQK